MTSNFQTNDKGGCFKGSVTEFADKARREGKIRYAAVIPAIAAAL